MQSPLVSFVKYLQHSPTLRKQFYVTKTRSWSRLSFEHLLLLHSYPGLFCQRPWALDHTQRIKRLWQHLAKWQSFVKTSFCQIICFNLILTSLSNWKTDELSVWRCNSLNTRLYYKVQLGFDDMVCQTYQHPHWHRWDLTKGSVIIVSTQHCRQSLPKKLDSPSVSPLLRKIL